MEGLNCVNGWCKYKDDFYCMKNCGSYIEKGTKFCDIDRSKIHAKYLLIFDIQTNENITHGELNEIFFNCSEFQDREIKEAHYDVSGSSTFIIGL